MVPESHAVVRVRMAATMIQRFMVPTIPYAVVVDKGRGRIDADTGLKDEFKAPQPGRHPRPSAGLGRSILFADTRV